MEFQQEDRPALDMQLVTLVLERWNLHGSPLAVEDLGGAYNGTWRVRGVRYDVVVRVRPRYIRVNRIKDVHALLILLNKQRIPTPHLRRSRSGSTFEHIRGRLVEVYDYLSEQENRHWSEIRWRAGFAHMAELHRALQSIQFPITPPTLSNYASAKLYVMLLQETLNRLLALPPSDERAEGIAICLEAQRVMGDVLVRVGKLDEPLPHQLVHGDFHLGNLLFDAADQVRYTLDFDFVAWRERIFEVAYALRLALPQLTDNTEKRLETHLVTEWLLEYDSLASYPLSPEERRLLPFYLAQVAIYFIADACRADDPLEQVLREAPYLELACHLVKYPESLLNR